MDRRKGHRAFTLIDILLCITLVSVLISAWVSHRFGTHHHESSLKTRSAVVGSVNTGLVVYHANSLIQGEQKSYPERLDEVGQFGRSGLSTPFFVNVVKGGVLTRGWTKVSDGCYTYHLGSGVEYFRYDREKGYFSLNNTCL